MYFTRYIWTFVRRIYFRSFKKRFKLWKLSKFPLTRIPYLLTSSVNRLGLSYNAKDLSKLTDIISKNIYVSSLQLIYNTKFKYRFYLKFFYNIKYNIYYFFNYFKVKYKIQGINKWLKLYDGRYYTRVRIPRLNISLSLLNETVTYGSKKKKEKKGKKKKLK